MADLTEKIQKLRVLVEHFRNNIDHYKTLDYKEARVRADFIDKFFALLDWDINNEEGDTEDFRDVIIEDNLEIQGAQKAPDYSFRIGGSRVFFVEAKKPSINLKDAIDPAFQVRRYGYTANLPVSILTDFEEFAIYDTSLKPNKNDKSTFARLFYCRFDEYEKNFEFIYNTFSKSAVKKGSIKEYSEGAGIKKGASAVDKEFLKLIEDWRSHLAKNIALRNLKLDIDQLNLAVQKIIDRIIFLRIAEDKEIELYENLLSIAKENKAYSSLVTYFEKANRKYNSELFKKDQLIDELNIDNEILLDIIQNLYYPESPYAFSVLPVEILGNIYEQFLGKTIRLTAGHQAKIEEKPEVRKAGGVYYTPQYIVEYIVANAVGEKIKNKSPEEIAEIKVLDPACGSGSFLLGAYTYLLNYHLKYYMQKEHLTKALKNNCIYQHGERSYRLTIQEKQKILLNNIYGVDIDKQATEVTKLSLMLKLLEGENHESAGQLFKQTELKLLPTLSNNIKCGNSLIGSDYYNDKNLGLFGKEEMNKVNVFDWEKEFSEIFKNGGFDCVIGNPPYVRQEMFTEFKEYFSKKYEVYDGVADLYVYFYEKGISLLNPDGIFGIIVANKWLRTKYGGNLRKHLRKQGFKQIIDFGDLPVFQGATTYPCITIIQNKYKVNKILVTEIKTLEFETLGGYVNNTQFSVNKDSLQDDGWFLINETEHFLVAKLFKTGISLDKYVNGKFFYGIKTGFNDAFVIDESIKNKLIKEDISSKELIKPFIAGRDVKRYQYLETNKYLIFTRRGIDIKKYSAIEKYLLQFKELLMPKPKDWTGKEWKGRKPGTYKWYEIQDSIDYYQEFEKPKIIYPNICKRNEFTYDKTGLYTNQKCFILSVNDKYLLGVLNSSAIYFLFKKILPKLRGDFYEPGYAFLKDFPIPIENNKSKKEKISDFVEQMLILSKQSNTNNDNLHIKQKIDIIDNQINQLVYELYNLSPEEIKLVEESVK